VASLLVTQAYKTDCSNEASEEDPEVHIKIRVEVEVQGS